MQDILAEAVSWRFVPITDGCVTDRVVEFLSSGSIGTVRSVLFDLDIGEVLSVPGILRHSNNGVELDERSILLFSNHSGPDELSITTFQVLEETSKNWAEFRADGAGRDYFGF
jgi:hypothetical protein